jgi:hypothetical protein
MSFRIKLNANSSGIVVKPSFAVISNPPQTVVIKNQATTISANISANRLDTLQDVVEEGTPPEGSTLVYNPTTDKYEVQKLNFTDVDGPLDGGSF